ncbi:MAG: DUF2341 domain-containing protein [Methanobacteriota archaeon]
MNKIKVCKNSVMILVVLLLIGTNVLPATSSNTKQTVQNNSVAEQSSFIYSFTNERSTWWNESWQYRKMVLINHTKVDGSLSNYPVLIKTIVDPTKVQSDGGDIVFIMTNGSKMNHEIESYNSMSGELVAWVNVPTLSDSLDTFFIMYYGNPSCDNQQNMENTWDADFHLVQHFEESAGTFFDSTFYHNDGVQSGGVTYGSEGKISSGSGFDGVDDYVALPDMGTVEQYPFTFECWFNTSSTDNDMTMVYQGRSGDTAVRVQLYFSGGTLRWNIRNNAGQQVDFSPGGEYRDDHWHHVVGVCNQNDQHRLFVDGVWKGNSTTRVAPAPEVDCASIGKWNPMSEYFFNGRIDEVRISNVTRSYPWISTEYKNMNDPDSFVLFGYEEQFPGDNYPPYISGGPLPQDNATGVNVTMNLSWFGGDPDPDDIVTYDVYFGTIYPPPQVVNNQSELTYDPGPMNYSTLYYWMVKAWDNHGSFSISPIWRFTTERYLYEIVYVDDDYNESTPGWDYDHFNSIQHSLVGVRVGGTVFVFNGTYYENVIVNKSIKLRGENRDGTIIDANGVASAIALRTSSGVNISGFTMQNSGNYIYGDSGVESGRWGIDSDNNIIVGNKMVNNIVAIYMEGSSHNFISNNIIINNRNCGINMRSSNSGNTISNNTFESNGGDGVYAFSSGGNIFMNNVFSNNTGNGLSFTESSSNYVIQNYFFNNNRCVSIGARSVNHFIYQNMFLNSREGGVILESGTSNNHVYHNNFVNNNINARDSNLYNVWDDGFPDGGNYWDDYTGHDTDFDGLGETPHNISGGSRQDRYPLIYEWGKNRPVANFSYIISNFTVMFNATSSYDRDGLIEWYHWEFSDGTNSTGVCPIHNYSQYDQYLVELTIGDNDGYQQTHIEIINVTGINDPPIKPTIIGPSVLNKDEEYSYYFMTNDPNLDDVYYYIDWGDNSSSEWIGPYHSDFMITVNHTWFTMDTFSLKVKAKDIYNDESQWNTQNVTTESGLIIKTGNGVFDNDDYISYNFHFPIPPRVVTCANSIDTEKPVISCPLNVTTDGFRLALIDHNGVEVQNVQVFWIAMYPDEYSNSQELRIEAGYGLHSDHTTIYFNHSFPASPVVLTNGNVDGVPIISNVKDAQATNFIIILNDHDNHPVYNAMVYWIAIYPNQYVDLQSNLKIESRCSFIRDQTVVSYTIQFPSSPHVVTNAERSTASSISYPLSSSSSGFTISIMEYQGNFGGTAWVSWIAAYPDKYDQMAPTVPNIPDGPTLGSPNNLYNYSTSSFDPYDENIMYGWDWDGNDIVDEWTGEYQSGIIVNTPHSWSTPGVYTVKVKAKNTYGHESDFSPALQVVITNPPYPPSNPDPINGSVNVNIDTYLNWTGGDPDPEDTVTYDLYYGIEFPLSKEISNQTTTIYYPETTVYNTTYYWRVIAWDNHGMSTSGPFWSFTTEEAGYEGPWWNTNWQYRKSISINHMKVDSNLFNFPIFVHTTLDTSHVQPDGDDIVFTTNDGSQLNHEIESYSDLTGELFAWVNIPYLPQSHDIVLYLYYGNKFCMNQQNVEGTWDAGYHLVQHFEEPSGVLSDSSRHHNDGIQSGGIMYNEEGKIGTAVGFDGSNDYVNLPDMGTVEQYPFTFECWFRTGSTDNSMTMVYQGDSSDSSKRAQIYFGSGLLRWNIRNGGQEAEITPAGQYRDSAWHHAVGVSYSRTDHRFFIDGVWRGNNTNVVDAPLVNRASIARWDAVSTYLYGGLLDEIRISNTTRSYAWISTEYKNQNDPDSFTTFGEEEELHIQSIVYVDDDASPEWYDETHVRTIQEGINNATTGDIVFVYNGIYYEHLVINKTINLTGEDKNNTIIDSEESGAGIRITVDGVHISTFTISNSWYGVYPHNSNNNTISDNVFINTTTGIFLSSSENNTIIKNIYLNIFEGIHLGSANNTIIENIFVHTGLFVFSLEKNIVFNNTVNDKPLIYLMNVSDTILDEIVGQIILLDCYNITIQNQDLSNTTVGIELLNTHNSSISGISLKNNGFGIYLIQSDNNFFMELIMSNNSCGANIYLSDRNNISKSNILSNSEFGIGIQASDNNTLINNTLSSNGYGIYCYDSDINQIIENTLSENGIAIFLGASNNNTISKNKITENIQGIDLTDNSYTNVIFHNNFINNTRDAIDPYSNSWNLEYPSGGNYWSDYDGSDRFSGPNQNISGGDGIGDIPYNITGDNNIDMYPLMKPWGFSISGVCHYVNMTPVDNLVVNIVNLNTGQRWQAETINHHYARIFDVGDIINISDPLRIIAKDDEENINVSEHIVTRNDLLSGCIHLDLILDIHYRDLKSFPYYLSQVDSGAMVMKQMLDYCMWNNTIYPQPQDLYNEQIFYDNYSGGDRINTSELCGGLNTEINDYQNGWIYGYFFNPSAHDQAVDALKSAVIWLDYNISGSNEHRIVDAPKLGHPYHVPIAVPTGGDYNHWMVIRGIHTNRSMWDTSIPGDHELLNGPVTIYGFWVNDPSTGGLGDNTYVTAEYFTNTYFQRLNVPDDYYDNKYVVITDPPQNSPPVDTTLLTLNTAKPHGFTKDEIKQVQTTQKNKQTTQLNNIYISKAQQLVHDVLRYDPTELDQTFTESAVLKTPTYTVNTMIIVFNHPNGTVFTVSLNKTTGELNQFTIK